MAEFAADKWQAWASGLPSQNQETPEALMTDLEQARQDAQDAARYREWYNTSF